MQRLKLLIFLVLYICNINAQDCSTEILSKEGGIRSTATSLIVRPNYSYTLEYKATKANLFIEVKSIGGEILDANSELIFLSVYNRRLTLKFTEEPSIEKRDVKIYANTIHIKKEDLDWLSKNELAFIYIKNIKKEKLIKYIAKKDKRYYFKQLSICFKRAWLNLNGDVESTPLDQDDNYVQEDLSKIKAKLRLEIEDEIKKAKIAKLKIQEDVMEHRLKANEKIKSFENDVLQAQLLSIEKINKKNKWTLDSILKMHQKLENIHDQNTKKIVEEDRKTGDILNHILSERVAKVDEINRTFLNKITDIEDKKKALIQSQSKEISSLTSRKKKALAKIESDYQKELLNIITSIKTKEAEYASSLDSNKTNYFEKIKVFKLQSLDSITAIKRKNLLELELLEKNKLDEMAKAKAETNFLLKKNALEIKRLKEAFEKKKEDISVNNYIELKNYKAELKMQQNLYKNDIAKVKYLRDSLQNIQDSLKYVHLEQISNFDKKAKLSIVNIDKRMEEKGHQLEVKYALDSIRIAQLLDSYSNETLVTNLNSLKENDAKKLKDNYIKDLLLLHKKYDKRKNLLEDKLIKEQHALALQLLQTQEKAYDEFNIIQEQFALAVEEEKQLNASKLQTLDEQLKFDYNKAVDTMNAALEEKKKIYESSMAIYINSISTLTSLTDKAKRNANKKLAQIQEKLEQDIILARKNAAKEMLNISGE